MDELVKGGQGRDSKRLVQEATGYIVVAAVAVTFLAVAATVFATSHIVIKYFSN
jgi:hypothetical protein